MRILGWECQINPEGTVRAASHPENGSICWLGGRLVGNCDAPPAVFEWLIRPQLRRAWESGCVIGLGTPRGEEKTAYNLNPYNGEPPNKDNEPS